jgi:hypothetical protein
MTNEEFLDIYQRPDVKIITKKAVKNFKFLGSDELKSCQMIGTWKAILAEKKNPKLKVKSTTNIYNHIVWECKSRSYDTYIKNIEKRQEQNKKIKNKQKACVYNNDIEYIDIIDSIQKTKNWDIVLERFLDRLTFTEIGDKRNFSHEAARKKLIETIENLSY